MGMKIEQRIWTRTEGWAGPSEGDSALRAQLVLVFGSTAALKATPALGETKTSYPGAHVFGCSTAGEILGTRVLDDSVVSTAIEFASTEIRCASVSVNRRGGSFQVGVELARSIPQEGLRHLLVLSDGLRVNGSRLVDGLESALPTDVSVTGGLSGDGERFEETLVVSDGSPESGTVGAVGLYGERLKVGFGSLGGWDPFGPERRITRSTANVLYELDGRSALDLYKEYLGDHADGLPATGLLFPLSLRTQEGERGVVRTIISIDEQENSLTFAGNVPEGAYARLMVANFDRLVDGSMGAATISRAEMGDRPPELAILISCVGRKLVLKQRIEEEVEGVRDVLGDSTPLIGFYSYGEISPFTPGAPCQLHNQTMTITTLSES
jgi:hypothetical protein